MALERTLILVKPDGVQRRLIGKIVSRIEDKGLQIVGLKMLQITPEMSRQHYVSMFRSRSIRNSKASSRPARLWRWLWKVRKQWQSCEL